MFQPGHNCIHAFEGESVSVLPSGETYFDALVPALEGAKETIYIAGWALDFKMWLKPDEPDGERIPLEPLLKRLVAHNPDLEIYILVWDMSQGMLIAADPFYWFRKRRPHRRVHLRYDNAYPFGGSQHQKFIVIDDAIAFIGGIDLTVGRWDSIQHNAKDVRRIDPYGIERGPFHDAQVEVRGRPATSAGEVFRTRWSRVLKRPPKTPGYREVPALTGDWVFQNAEVAIARTDPNGDAPVREVEALFEDSIAAAKNIIYIENQYLTSRPLGRLIGKRLREPDGPEVVLIGPRQPAGWAEEVTVGILRWRVVDHLRKCDEHGRLSITYPMASVTDDIATYVHMKLTIIDDVFVRVGSANVSQRSMNLDSELDLAFAVKDQTSRDRVVALRTDLVARHLRVEPDEVTNLLENLPLVSVIEALSGGNDHTLVPLGKGPAHVDRLFAQHADILVDPSEPIDLISAAESFVGRRVAKRQLESLPFGFLSLAAMCATLILLRYTAPEAVSEVSTWLTNFGGAGPWRWGLAAGAASLAVGIGGNPFLVVLLLMQAFGAIVGGMLGYAGMMGGAAFSYGLGRILGRHWVTTIFGIRVQSVRRRIFRRGAFSVAMLRVFPISRFHTVGAVAGASELQLNSYILGTVMGLAPWFLLISVTAASLLGVLQGLTVLRVSGLLLVLGGFWAFVYNTEAALQRRRNRKRRNVRQSRP